MKRIAHIVMLLTGVMILPSVLRADLLVSLTLDPVSAIEFEAVNAHVTVMNDGEKGFLLDESDKYNKAHAIFIISKKRDEPVARIGPRAPVDKLILAPGEIAGFKTDISLLYDIAANGRYVVKAAIDVGDMRYESKPVILDVVRGGELVTVSRSVPGYHERIRKYSLRYHGRNKKEKLFLCVDEDDGKMNYGAISLGDMIRVVKPTLEVDRDGNITVIHQVNRDCFACSRLTSNQDGVSLVDQTYHDAEGKPYRPAQEKPVSAK